MKIKKLIRILAYISFAFAFCFLAVGYAAVQDELIVNGTVAVDGYIPKYDFSAADTYGYTLENGKLIINEIYYDPTATNPNNGKTGVSYKVLGIAEGGFSSTTITTAKEANNNITLEATDIEAFYIPKSIIQIGANAFNGLSNLTYFDTEENTSFEFQDKILFGVTDDEPHTIVYYSPTKTEGYYIVDETKITDIADGAFSNNTYCTAILTSYYDDNAWGSPAAVMISTVGFLDTVTNVEGNVDDGYKVYLQNAASGESIVLQGNDDPDNNFYGHPKNVLVKDGGYVTISSDLCQPCNDHKHYSQIYLSSWQKLNYGYLTDDYELEIHNCRTAIVGGEVYQWVDDVNHRILPNDKLYNLPSGTVDDSKHLPEKFPSWTNILSDIKQVTIVDDVAPTSVSYWFRDMTACTEMNLAKLNTENITNMSYMFYNCKSVTELDLSHFDTSKVQSMEFMFIYCYALETIESNFDTTDVTTMFAMFAHCHSLKNLNVASFDTQNVTNMQSMFIECKQLVSLDLTNFNTSNVKNMSHMFQDAEKLQALDVSSFNTANVTTMYQMFNNCYPLTSLDLSSFNTSKVSDMGFMFAGNLNLETIYVSDKFVTKSVVSSTNMFKDCSSLVGGNSTTLKTIQEMGISVANSYKATYARIDGANGLRGYFTLKTGDVTAANVTINVDPAIGEYVSILLGFS